MAVEVDRAAQVSSGGEAHLTEPQSPILQIPQSGLFLELRKPGSFDYSPPSVSVFPAGTAPAHVVALAAVEAVPLREAPRSDAVAASC
jgi:hypothetical protein